MLITKQQLIEMKACSGGLQRFIRQTNGTDTPVDVSSLVGGLNTYHDLLWLARKTRGEERVMRFAFDCVLTNIELIKPYTDKYDLIVDFLRTPVGYHVIASKAAHAASRSADSAGDSGAHCVAIAAYYATRYLYDWSVDTTDDATVEALLIAMFNEVK